MPRKKTTQKIEQNTVRKCSVCRSTKHTKRSCDKLHRDLSKVEHKTSFVFVNAHKKASSSPHVVDLKKGKKEEVWSSVSPFKETTAERIKRIHVNFAEMVKNANQKHKEASKKEEHPNIDVFRKALGNIAHVEPESFVITSRVSNKKPIQTLPAQSGFSTVKEKWSDAKTNAADRMSAFLRMLKPERTGAFVAVLITIAILPFPALGFYKKVNNDTSYIVEKSTNAFLSLQSSTVAAFSNNLPQAQFDLNEALHGFSEAQGLIDKEYKALTYVASMLPVVGKRIESRQDILVAGHHIALGNTYLVKGIDEITKNKDISNTERLSTLKAHMRSALPQYQEALTSIASIDEGALPTEYQQSFADFRLLYAAFVNDMEDLISVIDGLEVALGTDDFRRYLVMFQNNYELRATGGFTGSYAIVDVQKGKILNMTIPGGGTYDVQGQLDMYVRPPLPLQLLNRRWEFQDVNWFPHFPTSARKTEEFYQAARNTSIDGVIAVNASVLERLLRIIGPVYNSEFDVALNAEDALTNLQHEVEFDYDKQVNEPKAILSSLLEQLLNGVKNVEPQQLLALVTEAHEAMEQKEIQVYFNDEQVEQKFRSFGWTGEITKTAPTQDYLMVVNTNIGGQKSDANTKELIEHQSVVQDDGSILNTVIIKREHTEKITDSHLFDSKNVNFVRVYVPEGSELIEAGGFSFPEEESFTVPEYWYKNDPDLTAIVESETIHVGSGTQVSREQDKTVFGNWVVTEPGASSEVFFTYKLPFTINDIEKEVAENATGFKKFLSRVEGEKPSTVSHYSLVVQKQSGANSRIASQVIYPNAWHPVWRTDDAVRVTLNGASFEADLASDVNFGVVMEYNKE